MTLRKLFLMLSIIVPLFSGIDKDLIEAAKTGNASKVIKLIEEGANLHQGEDDLIEDAPLCWAAKNNHTSVIELLLEYGANIHAKKRWKHHFNFTYNDAPLLESVENGHKEATLILLEKGANPSAQKTSQGGSALTISINSEFPEIAIILLKSGATDEYGYALKAAAGKNFYAVVEMLLTQSQTTFSGRSDALCNASEKGYYKICELLLKHGASTYQGGSWAFLAAATQNYLDIVKLFIAYNVNVEADENKALDWSQTHDLFSMFFLLIRNGANLRDISTPYSHLKNVSDKKPSLFKRFIFDSCKSIAMKALSSQCLVQKFYDFRFDPGKVISEGLIEPHQLLIWSIILNFQEAFNQLLENHECFNARDNYGMTALMYAAISGNEYMCNKLIDLGAFINLQNQEGRTAMQLANDEGFWNLASHLILRCKGFKIGI
jgi:ankyrin repeat protein